MTTGERLAAYLAGDLGADEIAAVEADLARDPGLRTRLERLRSTEQLLASLPPVEPSPEFSARLRDAVRAEASALADDAVVVPASELVRRRNRRRQLVQRAGLGIAAAAAVVAGVVVVGSLGGSGDDSMTSADSARDFDLAEDSGGQDTMAGAAGMAEMAPAAAPVVEAGGDYDEDSIGALTQDGRLLLALDQAAADPAGMTAAARSLGLALDDASRAMEPTVATGDEEAGDTAASGDGADDGAASTPQDAIAAGVLDPITVANRCLPAIYTEDRELVPLWLQTATFGDEPALIAVLASRGPDGELSRLELYAFGTLDCHVLFFQQADR